MKMFNKLSLLFSLFTVVMFSSCSWGNKVNIVPPLASNKNGIAELSIKLEGECAARMVENPTLDLSKLTFVLEGETSDSSKKVHEEFSFNSEVKIYVYFGKWNFTLTAYKPDDKNKTVVLKGALNDFVVNESTKKLVFDMEYGDAKGGLNYSVTYPSDEYTTLTVEVYKKPSGMFTNVSQDDLLYSYYFFESKEMLEFFNPEEGVPNTSEIVESEEGEATTVLNLSKIFSPGYYTLLCKVENYVCDQYDEDKLKGPAATSKYEATVPVVPGEVTSGSIQFTEINRMFNITYDVDESLGFEYDSDLYPSSFIKYRSIYIAPIDNITFGGWYYNDGTDDIDLPLVDEEGEYKGWYILNAGYLLSENVELKAKVLSSNNVIFSLYDSFSIPINGPELLEYENEKVTYSTVNVPGASYEWYWDGIKVENGFDQTCDINVSKLDINTTGYHQLKVVIDNNGVIADSKKDVFVGPYLIPYFNWNGMYDNWTLIPVNDAKKIYNGGIRSLQLEGGLEADSSIKLRAYCFDENNNFYAAEYYTVYNKYIINKYPFNVYSGFSEPEQIIEFEDNAFLEFFETDQVIKRMTTDGEYIYFVTGELNDYLYFQPEATENLFRIKKGDLVLTRLSLEDDSVYTALSYENGFLYLAGFKPGDERDISWTDNDGKVIQTPVHDYEYGIYKYPVFEGEVDKAHSESIYTYSDKSLLGANPLAEMAQERDIRVYGSVMVNNMISDLIVKNDCIYAVRVQSFKIDDGSNIEDLSYSVLYKDKNNFEFEIRGLNKRENVVSADFNICPLKILCVRRKELDFGFNVFGGNGKIISLDLSDPESVLLCKHGEYGYNFDQAMGSGFNAEYHAYFAGNETPVKSNE